ncbi:type II toxin-antitoxin system Phd/YefM family antitoxin [Roseitalea porphyridii]|uniref:Antitoxin n=1 Tax=Roseitalea porphyridii TaxID=1852022 RepID=A0A4P6V327_9HYPH|nr:type II toxin-antitoxin system prevent-host-death family antitoxin [Roseitalea porphyridii]QBK31615.1 type II toxin-antitoxin system prevent-host-death family antitoxin [Roseitalea porphyridii]
MERVGTYDARNRLSELIDMAERGEEVIITRHGKPVAKLVKAEADDDQVRRAEAAVQWIFDNRGDNSLGDLSVKDLIEEGRH